MAEKIIDDGGPAFSRPYSTNGEVSIPGQTGMSLRDYFAGMAISGMAENLGKGCIGYIEQRAEIAYQIADAMLAARKAKP